MSTHCTFLACILLLALVTTAQAQKKHWTPELMVSMEEPASPVISPDGSMVAFTVRKPDLVNSKWITQIYVVDAWKKVRQMTASAASCTSPAWSPDGTLLTFVSAREYVDSSMQKQSGTPQLFALSVAGGEARNLTQLENGVDEYAWSKDGRFIAIISEDTLGEEAAAAAEQNETLKVNAISTADPKPLKAVWIYDTVTGVIRKLKSVDRGVTNMDWSPDGKRIVYQTNITGEYNDEQKYDIWTIGIDGKQTQLTSEPGPETMPKYSTNGEYIAYKTQTVPDIEFAETDCSVMKSDGSEKRSLTQYFDYSIAEFVWRPGSDALMLLTNERTANGLYMVKLQGGKWTPLVSDLLPKSALTVAKNGAMAYTVAGPDKLSEIATYYNSDPGTLPPELNTLTSYSEQLDGLPLGKQEVISIKSSDGKFDIEAVLVKPVGYKEGVRYPLLLAYHGGPYGNFTNKRMQYYPTNILAERGVMVVMPNVRGSSGYSDKFSQANRYDLGGGDYRDAMDMVNHLIAQSMADSTRMGVMGGSYGGYMTNWTISQTQRFAAAVSLYGIFSWFTDWSNSFQPAFEQMYFGYNYWERPADQHSLWISRAPQTYAQNITTPALILHGTEDEYTNISNSREMYAALRELGREVEFVTYPRAGHGLRTEPNQYIDVLKRTVAWLERWMKP